MCLIIKKPAGRAIPEEFLANTWQRNNDGWGFFFADEGKVHFQRGLKYDDLVALNKSLPERAGVHIHLRMATSGKVNEEMSHPFVVRPGLLLMHNGVIGSLVPRGENVGKSDTWELARLMHDMTSGLDNDQVARLVRSEGFQRIATPLVQGSMVVLQDSQGTVRLGRDWHKVSEREWDSSMVGIEVSNTYAWTPTRERALAGGRDASWWRDDEPDTSVKGGRGTTRDLFSNAKPRQAAKPKQAAPAPKSKAPVQVGSSRVRKDGAMETAIEINAGPLKGKPVEMVTMLVKADGGLMAHAQVNFPDDTASATYRMPVNDKADFLAKVTGPKAPLAQWAAQQVQRSLGLGNSSGPTR